MQFGTVPRRSQGNVKLTSMGNSFRALIQCTELVLQGDKLVTLENSFRGLRSLRYFTLSQSPLLRSLSNFCAVDPSFYALTLNVRCASTITGSRGAARRCKARPRCVGAQSTKCFRTETRPPLLCK